LISESAERNKEPILEVLKTVLPDAGLVLEIASGTGQHVVHFAMRLARLVWQPSDPSVECRRSIAAWLAASNLPNVRAPLDLNVEALPWPVETPDAVVCINMTHIAPWSTNEALFRGAALALRAGGLLFLYGPFLRAGTATAPGNLAFDRELRARNPAWGLREVGEVARLAAECGFAHLETVGMPANNLSVLFRRRRVAISGTPPGGS
jgi:SAM-dependent methyltransferase